MTKTATAAAAVLGLAALGQGADACGPWFILRPSLRATFWQPSVRIPEEMLSGPPRSRAAAERPYAGMSGGGRDALGAAREAYQAIARWRVEQYGWWSDAEGEHLEGSLPAVLATNARRALDAAEAAGPSRAEAEELALIRCKVSLREAESLLRKGAGAAADRRRAFEKARAELTAFLARAHTPALASEARGWLARCHYLLGEQAQAARIYLDELARPDSALPRDTVLLSLHVLFPYNGSDGHLADHLDDYFDTPDHALFAVTLVTNPVVNDEDERRAMAAVGQKALAALERHRELFAGAHADRLVLASMRASLYLGDPERALAFARALPAGSKAAGEPETRWMTGVAHFLLGRYAEAEPDLLAVARAPGAPDEPRGRALLGLLAVYQKLDRPVDQLLAGLRYAAWGEREHARDPGGWFLRWSPQEGDWLLDVSYLLDVQLTDEQLQAARDRLGRERLRVEQGAQGAWSDARALVDYALAVRAARREDYTTAAALYTRLGASRRAARMQEAARVCASAPGKAPDAQRRFACASFLAAHPARLFFNDRLWDGFQRYALLKNAGADPRHGVPSLLTEPERTALLENERRFQDAQEERWRAFHIFDSVAVQEGHTPLGRRAALRALECLMRLGDNDRFGRADDIKAARRRLAALLRERPAARS